MRLEILLFILHSAVAIMHASTQQAPRPPMPGEVHGEICLGPTVTRLHDTSRISLNAGFAFNATLIAGEAARADLSIGSTIGLGITPDRGLDMLMINIPLTIWLRSHDYGSKPDDSGIGGGVGIGIEGVMGRYVPRQRPFFPSLHVEITIKLFRRGTLVVRTTTTLAAGTSGYGHQSLLVVGSTMF